jgi:hypothetical protein
VQLLAGSAGEVQIIGVSWIVAAQRGQRDVIYFKLI